MKTHHYYFAIHRNGTCVYGASPVNQTAEETIAYMTRQGYVSVVLVPAD